MDFNCERCHYKEFNVIDGYYYCKRCSAQSTTHREVEFSTNFGDNLFNLTTKTKIPKKKSKYEYTEITTWEQYNFILLGFVNELIELGAKEELKLTVLQLWTTYLRINEIAFYSKSKKPTLPKLGASFSKYDAQIIYNLQQDRKLKRKSPSITSNARKLQKELLSAEYETTLNLEDNSIHNLSSISSRRNSSTTENTNLSATAEIQFSRKARRLLKNHMPKAHITKHEKNGKLDCHTFKRLNDSRSCAPEIVSRNVLLEIIYLALNQINDNIQLADLIRFLKDGHLSFYSMSHFFPPNIKLKNPNIFSKGGTVFPSHNFIRLEAAKQVKELNLQLKLPNFNELCKRYVKELCLPNDVNKMIETLLLVCQPEMKVKYRTAEVLPNYEARAMAYILFILKLLFGLDNLRENQISKSAEQINKKLDSLSDKNKPNQLFVWHEWVQYIEMRDIILKQCYLPATFTTTKSSSVDVKSTTTAYLNFINKQKNNIDTSDDVLLTKQSILNNAKDSFRQIKEIFNETNTKNDIYAEQKRLLSLQFPPSLTPKMDNLKYIQNNNRYLEYKIEICDFMKVDHTKRDILPFLYPNKLIRYMKNKKINIKPIRLKSNENIEFKHKFCSYYPNIRNPFQESNKLYEYSFGISVDDWEDEIENTKINEMAKEIIDSDMVKEFIQNRIKNIKEENHLIKANKIIDDPSTEIQFETSTVNIENETFIIQPVRINEQIPLFDFVSSDEDEDDDDKDDDGENNDEEQNTINNSFEFYLSNFDHWIYMGQFGYDSHRLSITEFEHIMETMPRQFEWLMKHCASIIECHERELYRELLIIENQFAYILKQFIEMTNMLKLQTQHSKYNYVAGLAVLIQRLHKYW